MNVKTITAPTIHAALIEARRVLGDGVVLLESIPPHGGEPARITVMADEPSRAALPAQTQRVARAAAPAFGYQPEKQPELAMAGSDQSAGRQPHSGRHGAEENTRAAERLSAQASRDYSFEVSRRSARDVAEGNGNTLNVVRSAPGGDGSPGTFSSVPSALPRRASGAPGRGNLFPNRGDSLPQAMSVDRSGGLQVNGMEAIENLLQAQLRLLHDRLDKIERRFERAIIGAAQEWTVNPLFGSMLSQGFRPATITRLFDTLANKGYQPDTNTETLKWALAQELRRSMDITAPKQTNGAQVFIGPSGAGKTSLLLKLAKHPGFYGRRETALIVIEPEDQEASFHHSPVELFRSQGLPVQAVRTTEEMRRAILRVQHFDHILIDTPPMPVQKNAAAKVLRHIKRLVDPIMPLRVQFVLNATRSLEDFDASSVKSLALRPEAVALTHLDETQGWGRIAEWLMNLEMPVQYVSTNSAVPDGVISFSPTWFVEEMMKL